MKRFVLLLHSWWCNMMNLPLARLHRWHLHKWSLSCFCHLWSGSDITVQLQNRCCHGWRHKQAVCDWMPLLHELYFYMFVWYRLKCKHGEGLDRARRNRGHCEDGKQGKILHRISFILPRRYLFTSKRHLIYVVLLQRQICIQDCLCRDATLEWEWLTGLRCSGVPEIGMVL